MKQITVIDPSQRTINSVVKQYSTFSYYVQLLSILNQLYPQVHFKKKTKYDLHKLLNDTFLRHYQGEEFLKYLLTERFLEKRNLVGAYEINVNTSRADFLTINGHTTCYEIKSRLDNFNKLEKQIQDYQSVFDYNYLVVDHIHFQNAKKVIPNHWGLWYFKDGTYKIYRRATLNLETDATAQLNLLSKAELRRFFGPSFTETLQVLDHYSSSHIAETFRTCLKYRYHQRWNFLTSNSSDIMPIDYQFFFNNNINPATLYTC